MKLKFKIVIFIQINTGISNFTRNQTTQNAFISIYYIQKFNNLVQCLNSKMKKKKKKSTSPQLSNHLFDIDQLGKKNESQQRRRRNS
jgi:hypothetical protein